MSAGQMACISSMSVRQLITVLSSVLALAYTGVAQQVRVPITVGESAGIDRTDEPVSSGIPLPQGKVKDLKSLVLVDKTSGKEVPCQFAVLGSWPDKSVKWVLLDFFASMKAGGKAEFTLTNEGRKSEPEVAAIQVKDSADAIEVNTGPLQFKISKKRCTILDEVTANGAPLITPQERCESIMVLGGGYPVSTADGAPTNTTVEMSGPLRTVIRSEGAFLNTNKAPIYKGTVTYEMRVTAYAGKPYIKLDFSIRNAGPFAFGKQDRWINADSWGIRFPISQKAVASGNWAMTCADGQYQVEADKPARLNQWLMYPENNDIGWISAKSDEETKREAIALQEPKLANLETNGVGFYYMIHSKDELKALGQKASGWAALSRGDTPLVTVISRNFWQNAPRGFSASPGELVLNILPDGSFWPRSEKMSKQNTYLLYGTIRKTAESLVWFGPVKSGCAQENKRFERPLIARAPASWYAETGAVWPMASLMPRSPEEKTAEAITRYEKLQRAKIHRDAGELSGPSVALPELKKLNIPNLERDVPELFVGKKYSIVSLRDDYPEVFAGFMNFGDVIWGFGYCQLHYDFTYGVLLQHLRFEDPDMFYVGQEMAQHRCDVDKGYSGLQHYEKGFHGFNERIDRPRYRDQYPPNATHNWCRGIFLHGALTGDPASIREANATAKAMAGVLQGVKGKQPSHEFRLYGWSIEACMAAYEYTGDETYLKTALDGFTDSLLKLESENGGDGMVLKDGKQSAQFVAYCINALISLHHYSQKKEVAEFLKRVLDFQREEGTEGGKMQRGKYLPLMFCRGGDKEGDDDGMASLSYNLQFADGYAYLYSLYGRKEDLKMARQAFQDFIFYYGANQAEVEPAFRTPLGYHFRTRVDNMVSKIHSFSTRFGQSYLMVEAAAGDKK